VRRRAEWLNPTNAKKVHSLVDKVYQRKNGERAWERVRANRGSGGVDGQTLEEVARQLNEPLDRLHSELKQNIYQPQPVRQVPIPKLGKPGEFRLLGIPTIYDRVCQQALLNRLEPIFEPVFEEANFGYRRGRSTKDALRKVWREIHSGRVWIVDADLKDFFDHSSGCSFEKRNCWRVPPFNCSSWVRVVGVSGNKYRFVVSSRRTTMVPL
jgi:RNA-directed DNA polymerase